MRSLKSIHRKAKKRNAQRKDFEKKRNINRNVPTIKRIEKVEKYREVRKAFTIDGYVVMKRVFGADGMPELELDGYKIKVTKIKNYRHKDPKSPTKPRLDSAMRAVGMIFYPKSRK